MSGIDHMTSEQRPACSKCQTPMVRYNVPHTGGKEQAWRLACSCKHSVVSEVVPSNLRSLLSEARDMCLSGLLRNGVFHWECEYCGGANLKLEDVQHLGDCLVLRINESLMRPVETTALPHMDTCGLKYGTSHCTCGLTPEVPTPVETSRPRFTPEQLRFIRNEMNASLACGAIDPLFQSVYDRAKEILRGSPMKPSPAHTTEQDFQHWLSYSGMRYSFKHVATEPDLRAAYYAGADVAPVKAGGCPTHGMEHFFEGMCIKCGTVGAENGT